MLLNQSESLSKIMELLDDPSVYKYEPTYKDETITTGELPDEVTETVQVVDKTAAEVMQGDLICIADEVYLSEMLLIISAAYYASIMSTPFANYTVNQKRLFYAECYFVASKFLISWSLKNETEMYKSTLDFNSRTVGVEKSGKLYTAEEYAKTAKSNVANYEREVYSTDADINRSSSISIGRY